jgi:hypothetical protein
MIDFESRYVVSDQQWQKYCEDRLEQYVNDPGDGTIPVDELNDHNAATLAYIDFLKTGDISAYIDSANKNSHPIGWSSVFESNPSRDYDEFISNIQLFWRWVLEFPSSRIENSHLYDAPKVDNCFWGPVYSLSSGGGIADGPISNRLFLEVFGSEFQSNIQFPFPLGSNDWFPKTIIDSEEFFFRIMGALEYHLFEKPKGIHRGIVAGVTDYWLSIIPHLGADFFSNTGYFSLEHDEERYCNDKMGSDEELVFTMQRCLRRFFGQLHGFNVDEDNAEYVQNDPELADYIKARFAQFDLPVEYYEFIAFIHRHKENAMNASEGPIKEEPKVEVVKVEELAVPPEPEEHLETELTFALREFCAKHSFKVNDDLILSVQPGAPWEIEEGLYSMFKDFGALASTESGFEPVEFLPSYVLAGLRQIDCGNWKVLTCISEDGWMNATVILETEDGSLTYEMYVERVNNSDWVPEGLENALQLFAKDYSPKTLKFLYSDAEFLMLPLTESQMVELNDIVNDPKNN